MTGTELLHARPELAPEIMAAFGEIIGQRVHTGQGAHAARVATERHRQHGTDLGPLTVRALSAAGSESAPAPAAISLDDLRFEAERCIGLTRDDLRGSIAALWQIRDSALRAIAIEASGLTLDEATWTREALWGVLQHGHSPLELERARRDLSELLARGAGPRLRGHEPLDPTEATVLIRHGLQTDNTATVAAGLVAAHLPENIAARLVGLGRRLSPPPFRVPWILHRGIDVLDGAVSRAITAREQAIPTGWRALDQLLSQAATAPEGSASQGLAIAARAVADRPDDPHLPPLLLALRRLDAAGRLQATPEETLQLLLDAR